MADVCYTLFDENDNRSVYCLMPGQAFPIYTDRTKKQESFTELWLFYAMFSDDKIYTDLSDKPYSKSELLAKGVYETARTRKQDGLMILSFDVTPYYLWPSNVISGEERVRTKMQIPVSKFFDLASVAKEEYNHFKSILPNIYLKVHDGKEKTGDVHLWDAKTKSHKWFRKAPIHVIISDPLKADNTSWGDAALTFATNYEANLNEYLKRNADLSREIYVSYGNLEPTIKTVEHLVPREEYAKYKDPYSFSHRKMVVGTYCKNDPFGFMDTHREHVNDLQYWLDTNNGNYNIIDNL